MSHAVICHTRSSVTVVICHSGHMSHVTHVTWARKGPGPDSPAHPRTGMHRIHTQIHTRECTRDNRAVPDPLRPESPNPGPGNL
jgi:hypothetical protein